MSCFGIDNNYRSIHLSMYLQIFTFIGQIVPFVYSQQSQNDIRQMIRTIDVQTE